MPNLLVFPVRGEHNYRNDWHAPRGGGSRLHMGTDIFAAKGTKVVAVAGGTVSLSTGGKGGNAIWLGNRFYYAHLDRFAVKDGQRVKPGQVIGYVGDTGNAKGTSPHLHFGMVKTTRDNLDWQNPFPLLKKAGVVRDDPTNDQAQAVAGMGDEFEQAAPLPNLGTPPPTTPSAPSPGLPGIPGSQEIPFNPREAADTWRLLATQPLASPETRVFAGRFEEDEDAA